MLAVKNEILWVGIGEGGSKVVKEVLDRDSRYVGMFLNTSSTDLEKLGKIDNVHHIPNAKGTGRDRALSKQYARKHFESIIDSILAFSSQKVINIAFSISGGTGSGLAPTVAKLLLKMIKDMQLDKIVNLIVILPSMTESKTALKNSIDCWNEVVGISKLVNNIMFIDNNCGKPLNQINSDFADLYDAAMDIPQEIGSEEFTQIDESDLGRILFAKGCSSIYEIDLDFINDNKRVMKNVYDTSVFAKLDSTRSTHLCMSFNNFDYDFVMQEFKPREEHFKGYNSEKNIIVIGGLKLPKETVELIQAEIQYRESESEYEDIETEEDYIIENNKVEEKKPITPKNNKVVNKKSINKRANKLFDENFWENEIF